MKTAVKKSLAFFLAVVMLFGAAPLSGFIGIDFLTPASAASVSDLTFELINGGTEYEVSDCNEAAAGALTIPATYNGKSVTSIGNWAFSSCRNLKSVSFGENSKLTSIGDHVFDGCSSLTSIEIPSGVTSISPFAFSDSAIYNTSSNWVDNVLYIGEYLIEAKDSISGSYTIKPGTKLIADDAFLFCDSLEDITIPTSVTSIGNSAFFACDSLISILIPNSVTSIGVGAFSACDSLKSITVAADNAYYSNDEQGVLFNKSKTALVQYPNGNTATYYEIPSGVTSIGVEAFSGCSSLTSITFAEGSKLNNIGSYAFSDCSSLTSIEIPSYVVSIYDYAFSGCSSLADVYYGGSASYRANIIISDGNEDLINARWHYDKIDNPTPEQELSFFEKIIAFFKNLFASIFGIFG